MQQRVRDYVNEEMFNQLASENKFRIVALRLILQIYQMTIE
ncbi:hypothetical protein [secondary endosymbiont of Ctenarytaina eucalypti]|uniref:Uncharacterized protein n=1 Tax=secondary endosymbiont of Ctenarytaina eucalypti TaxID=1199245 RepID=J3TX08_9ENTR|nr:hypothetical protein [secondary endosymbiont of Ctenarytaina eucalypti]AFP84600.1 hypothetical protein A359_01990 [secondary endosymbiont of Ctenarytaina eucalypti]